MKEKHLLQCLHLSLILRSKVSVVPGLVSALLVVAATMAWAIVFVHVFFRMTPMSNNVFISKSLFSYCFNLIVNRCAF